MTLRLRVYRSDDARRAGIEFKQPRDTDAGFDLPSLEEVVIEPGAYALLRTGLHVAIPADWVGIVRDRSSIALRGGLTGAGVIDSSYRGEVKVLMHNLSKEPLAFKRGERIAQMVVVEHLLGSCAEEAPTLDALGETERGSNGFGSTGR